MKPNKNLEGFGSSNPTAPKEEAQNQSDQYDSCSHVIYPCHHLSIVILNLYLRDFGIEGLLHCLAVYTLHDMVFMMNSMYFSQHNQATFGLAFSQHSWHYDCGAYIGNRNHKPVEDRFNWFRVDFMLPVPLIIVV